MDADNPLIPAASDLAWTGMLVVVAGLGIVAVALAIWALVTLTREAPRMPTTAVALWAAVILVVTVVGPIAWLVAGRRSARDLPPA